MKSIKLVLLVLGVACLSPMVASAQPPATLTTLVNFNGTNGSSPEAELVLGADGNFYGTTTYGGTNSGSGTVFRISLAGALTSLVSFDGTSGWLPQAGLTADPLGNLYGSTLVGGTNADPINGANCGNIFKLSTNGALTSIFSFNNTNGEYPDTTMQLGRDGNLYGTTQIGGTNVDAYGTGYGTVFCIAPGGGFTTLVEFNVANGSYPLGKLLMTGDGTFYGTTECGGPNDGYGTVFKLTTNGVLTTLVSFGGTNGAGPLGGLLQGRDGSLYGATFTGGTNTTVGNLGVRNDTNSVLGFGTLFRLTPDGSLTTLVCFNETNGAYPHGTLLLGPDGNIYGTTSGFQSYDGYGTVFQLMPNGTLNTLVTFNVTNGAWPYAGLALGPDGNLYGTTSGGGAYGKGTVFRLTVPMTPVLQSVQSIGGQFVFSWNSVAGLDYQVQYNSDAGSTNWVNAGPVVAATSGTTFQTNAIAGSQGFYRVLLVP